MILAFEALEINSCVNYDASIPKPFAVNSVKNACNYVVAP